MVRVQISTPSSEAKPRVAAGRTVRAALTAYGFTRGEITRVLPDLEAGRVVKIPDQGFDFTITLLT
jgi:hypothetical protein